MSWVKLKRGNDWGIDYWARKPHDDNGYASSSRGVRFVNGEKVRVQLKDGFEVDGIIKLVERDVDVPDHGHSNLVRTSNVSVVVAYHGAKVELSVDQVRFEKSWVEAREPA